MSAVQLSAPGLFHAGPRRMSKDELTLSCDVRARLTTLAPSAGVDLRRHGRARVLPHFAKDTGVKR